MQRYASTTFCWVPSPLDVALHAKYFENFNVLYLPTKWSIFVTS